MSSTSSPVSISPGPLGQFAFNGLNGVVAGTAQTVTVEAEDAYGNELTSFNGTVNLSSSDPQLTGLPSSYDFSTPAHAFTVTFKTAGSQSITADDTSATIFTTSNPVSITPAALSQFAFNGLTGVTAGTAQTVTVEAEDAYQNEVSSFSGTVDFSSSDAQIAGLPASYDFTSPEQAVTITFKTAGSQSITANDVAATVSSTSGPVSISPGALGQFVFNGLTATSAGAAQTITVEAEDAYGNELSSFNGTVDFSSSDPQLTGLPASFDFTSPEHAFTITFETAGSQSITANDVAATISSNSSPVSISPGPLGQFAFNGLNGVVAGTAQTVTVEAEDAYGNELTSFNGTVSFTSSDSQLTGLPASFDFTSAEHAFTVTFETAGSQSITANDVAATVSSTSSPVSISPGPLDQFVFNALTGSSAGAAQTITVEAEDAYGNELSSFNGTVDFSSSNPHLTGLPASFDFTSPQHAFTITFETAGSQSITANDVAATVSSTSTSVIITPGALDQFVFNGLTGSSAGAAQTITIEAEDAYGNELTSFNGTVSFTSSDSQLTGLPASFDFTSPEHAFTISFGTAGSQSITATDTDATVTSTSPAVSITPGALDQLAFIGLVGVTAGTAQTITVEAEDAYGNELSSFSGTVNFSSSDAQLTGLPASYDFTSPEHAFTITFKTAGMQSITADDMSATVSSTSSAVSISPGALDQFAFNALTGVTAGSAQTITIEAEDAYGNEVSSFTGTVDFTSSDSHLTGLPASYAFSGPEAAFTITFETAGSQSITANDVAATVSTTSSPVSISPGPLEKFAFVGLANGTAGTAQTVTVEAEDEYSNTLTSFTGTVDFTSSDPNLSGLPASYDFSAPEHAFTITFETAGSQSITADDVSATVSSTSNPVSISPGALDQFAFSGLTSTTAGTAQTITVEAEDAYGNVLSSFNGTVGFTSSDPQLTGLPTSYDFTSPEHAFTITFKTAGSQSITADDTAVTVSTNSSPVNITAGSLDKFAFDGLTGVTAGTAQTMTVEAEDAYGNEVSSFSGTVSFTSSDTQLAGLPASYDFTSPEHPFTITFKTAGSQSITANDVAATVSSTSSPVSISPGPLGQFAFNGLNGVVAGTAQTVTVEAEDAYGNELTSFNGTVNLSSSDPQLTGLPSSYDFSTPAHAFTVTFKTAGSQSITADDTSATIFTTSNPVSITPAALSQFAFNGLTGVTAGTAQTVTVEAEDAYQNEVSSFSGTVDFSSSDAQIAGLPASYDFTSPEQAVTITFKTAGSQSITANDVALTVSSTSGPVSISPGALGQFVFNGLTATSAGAAQTITVEAEDAYGNELSSFNGTVDFSSSDPQLTGLPASYNFSTPEHAFTIAFETAGTQSITATDAVATVTTASSTVLISPGALSQFSVSLPSPTTAGSPESVVVEAEDAYGNDVTSFTGTIHFSSSDPQAVLPANYIFQPQDDGHHTFSAAVTLETAGPQTVSVESLGTPSYTGISSSVTVNPSVATTLVVASSGLPGVQVAVSVTAYDAYGNIATGYNGTVDFTTTDSDAILPTSNAMSSGVGSFVFTFSSTDTYTVTVTDSENHDLTGDTTVSVFKQTTQAGDITSSAPQTFYGENVTLTATFSATAVGSAQMTGAVAFYDGTTYLGIVDLTPVTTSIITDAIITPATAPDTVESRAMLTTTALAPGTYVIQAVYAGDSNYAAATSDVPVTVNVQPATTSTTLSTVTGPAGTTLTASVVVTSPGNPPIVGTVSFYDGSTLLGIEPVVDGVATYNIGVLSAGSHIFSAAFSGGGTSSTSGSSVNVSTDGPQIIGLSREGFNQRPTVIVLTFNQPLSVAAAQNPANYELFNQTGHRYALATVLYNPTNLTVSIVPSRRLPVTGKYTLLVVGTGASGITNANGLALDGTGTGQPGSNFVTKFNWRALASPNSPPAVKFVNGEAYFYKGGFASYVHAAYAATQYYFQHVVPRNLPRPIVPPERIAALHASVRPKIVLDGSPASVEDKLLINERSRITRKPYQTW